MDILTLDLEGLRFNISAFTFYYTFDLISAIVMATVKFYEMNFQIYFV